MLRNQNFPSRYERSWQLFQQSGGSEVMRGRFDCWSKCNLHSIKIWSKPRSEAADCILIRCLWFSPFCCRHEDLLLFRPSSQGYNNIPPAALWFVISFQVTTTCLPPKVVIITAGEFGGLGVAVRAWRSPLCFKRPENVLCTQEEIVLSLWAERLCRRSFFPNILPEKPNSKPKASRSRMTRLLSFSKPLPSSSALCCG